MSWHRGGDRSIWRARVTISLCRANHQPTFIAAANIESQLPVASLALSRAIFLKYPYNSNLIRRPTQNWVYPDIVLNLLTRWPQWDLSSLLVLATEDHWPSLAPSIISQRNKNIELRPSRSVSTHTFSCLPTEALWTKTQTMTICSAYEHFMNGKRAIWITIIIIIIE